MKSMTGYGRAEATLGEGGDWVVAVELSGVNRKQTDIAVNMPNQLVEEIFVTKRVCERFTGGLFSPPKWM